MSSTAYATPLRLELKPSRNLLWVLTATHFGALGLLPATSLPVWLVVSLSALVVASYARQVLRFAWLRSPASVVSLFWPAGEQWRLRDRSGGETTAFLLPDSFIKPWLTILLFRPDSGGRVRNVIILPDALDAESFRRLRVRLRLNSPTPLSTQPAEPP